MPVEAILFDFDGTIVDTETPDYEAWRVLFEKRGLELSKDLWRQRVGKVIVAGVTDHFDPVHYFHQLTGTPLDENSLADQQMHYLRLCEQAMPLPGVLDLLEKAHQHGIKMAIGSNSDRQWVEHWARHFNVIHYFGCIFTRDDVENPKPAPDMYLQAAQCLGVSPDRCVVIEDSPTGMQAAVAAGIRCIAVPNWLTIHLERPAVALTLNSLTELPFEALMERF